MRLSRQPGERLDRDRTLRFSFEGRPLEGLAGDTVASALFASGRRVFSRSFKYHRPRGLLCCSGHCPNCMMTVDGVPNVRTCVTPLREGAVVKAQNVRGSLDFDLMRAVDLFGGPFTPVGFYYRTMIRPRRAWPYYEKLLRNAAGLGRLDRHGKETHGRYDHETLRVDVLVVGGGEAGVAAARAAVAEGGRVLLVDEGLGGLAAGLEGSGVQVLQPAVAIGAYEGGLVPVVAGDVLYRVRAGRTIFATGALEQPLVFCGNDLPGVMLPGAVRRLVREFALRPGSRAVVIGADERGLSVAADLEGAGTEIAAMVDLRDTAPRAIEAKGRKNGVTSVRIDGATHACDLVVMSGGRQPAYSLLAQLGARVEYDRAKGIFVPASLPEGTDARGSVTGDVGPAAVPAPSFKGDSDGKCVVCFCEDVTVKDVERAIAEGFDSIELAKRYTTVTMGPCQGKLCHLSSIRLYAQATGLDEGAIGTTTARPPWTPVSLGRLAGRPHENARRTSLHHRHLAAGAEIVWTGPWQRPHSYGDVPGEVRAVHEAVGVIDVSTLGKLAVVGPDAAAFLERLYPNTFADLKMGRVRYGVLTTDGGRIMDDGTIARLSEHEFYVTTTSTGAGAVVAWFGWWNAIWGMDVEIVDVTGGTAAVNVAGPNARELLSRLTDLDVSADGIRYLDAVQGHVAGVPALVLRIGFVGELGYEIHFPAPYGEYLWDTLLERGADLGIRPFGLEPQRVLRLEKQHIIVGQDTDSESTLLSAGLDWLPKLAKEDFVGKWAYELVQDRGARERLVGFTVLGQGAVPADGAQIVGGGRLIGRVTSSRWSEAAGKAIGLCWLPPELAADGSEFEIRTDGAPIRAVVQTAAFYDPEGARLRS